MKNLLLTAVLGALGYFAYWHWFAGSEPGKLFLPAQPAAAEEKKTAPEPEPVDPWLRGRVGKLFEEWKRRNASTDKRQHVFILDMAEVLSDIKMRGPFTDQVIASKFTKILIDLGVSPEEAGTVAAGIVKEAARDGMKGGHDRASLASEDKSGGGSAP